MKKHFALPVIGSILVSIVLLVLVFNWLKPTTASEIISQEEIIQSIEELYSGEFIKMVHENEQYIIQIKNENGSYEITVDSTTGNVLSVAPVKTEAPAPGDENNEGDQSNNDVLLTKEQIIFLVNKETPGEILSLELVEENQTVYYKAVVSHNQQKTTLKMDPETGKVISNTTESIEQSNQFITNKEAIAIAKEYLNGEVEDLIFKANSTPPHYLVEIEADDNEAIIQIHGVSGKILSVTWDDDDFDEDHDDHDD